MASSDKKPNKIDAERASANTKSGETELCYTYLNERRERNAVDILLNISNSVDDEEERSFDCANRTGWENAVEGWNKTPPFVYLQLQQRARKARTNESSNGCLYCSELMQVIDKGLEQDPKTTDQLKSNFKLSTYAATDSISGKQQTLLSSNTTTNASSAVDEPKKESHYGKVHSFQTSQEEKTKTIFKDVPSSLSERKFFLTKENPVCHIEKKAVPIKEYNILSPEKLKNIEVLKYKDRKSSEPSVCSLVSSEAPAAKSSLVLPPVKDAAPKNSLDPSTKKSKTTLSQTGEKAFHAVSETVSCPQVFKAKEQRCEMGIDAMYNAVKEQIKMHEIDTLFPRRSKASFISRHLDQCYWHCALLPDRKVATMSNSIAMRRNSHPNSMHFLHTKGLQFSKASEIRHPFIRSRSHTGMKQRHVSKPQEIPLVSGLFPSLTERSWGRATPFACCKIQKTPKRPSIDKTVSNISHRKMTSTLNKNLAWVNRLRRNQRKTDCKLTKKEPISRKREIEASSLKAYNRVPKITTYAEGERMRGKLDSIHTFLGEKRTLPIKEYEIKYSQPRTGPEVLRYNKISLPKVIHGNPPNSFSCITLNALLVFRPDEHGAINCHLEPPSNTGAKAVKRTEKEDSTTAEMVSQSHATRKVKQKSRKKNGYE
ncbi:uncharacterized protein C16orf46 homolog [Sceloporus undulatus]|uniref:uncharacterized protein C16orf46 homolog n=1 Tax=Sceloporus undulatus TaxID=8520 RepID=UPI001C4C5362|nr:uncharacterized protein C16orf46 homolog [Sceloporus undulatus]XP_042294738.1 uncharacterized protein C16orf46 homolog [Sceloporus undulatus]XP_042294739.1 uncharacterized protein C16orf46 homolog [Sceloporus undulatus]XP_042294740.1 uncharacterized protein C16orf46 homolog [Sceloporus undulatus]